MVEKSHINTFQNSAHDSYLCVVYIGNVTSGSTCTNNFMETMEGIPMANRFLAG